MSNNREYAERDAMDLAVISLITKRYHEFLKVKLKGYSFTPNEISSMIYLLNDPDTDTAKGISAKYGVTQSLICRSVDSLSERGYLNVVNDRQDRRINHLSVIIDDEDLKERLLSVNADFLETIFKDLPAEDVDAFRRVLEGIEMNIK